MYIENDRCLAWRTVLVFIHYFVPDALYTFNSLVFCYFPCDDCHVSVHELFPGHYFLTVSRSRNSGRVFEHEVMSCAT